MTDGGIQEQTKQIILRTGLRATEQHQRVITGYCRDLLWQVIPLIKWFMYTVILQGWI